MRRRLQFSLLGLLLLTAAIAVGVKLWHGPHHEEFTLEDIGNRLGDLPRFYAWKRLPVRIHMSHVNAFDGRHQSPTVVDFDHFAPMLTTVRWTDSDDCLYAINFGFPPANDDVIKERIVRQITVSPYQLSESYFLSELGFVYRDARCSMGGALYTKIDPLLIADRIIRQAVIDELSSIKLSTNSPIVSRETFPASGVAR